MIKPGNYRDRSEAQVLDVVVSMRAQRRPNVPVGRVTESFHRSQEYQTFGFNFQKKGGDY